ncbi:MAG TPA: divergent polysaccharide deacetylase family protein [Rhizomicrobium sp.]
MRRRTSIRAKKDPALLGAEAVFWMLIVLACAVGGSRAIVGAPMLVAMLVPQGIMSAHASDDPAPGSATLPIAVPPHPSEYAPAVLTPVASHGFPGWLLARIADAHAPAAPAAAPPHGPAIAIVIDDMGSDATSDRRAIALPKQISLAFLPYPQATPELAREGIRAGHEILVHVPMEPVGTEDPGPNALLPNLQPAEITRRLDWALDRVPGYDGINNHEGSKFTANRAALIPVIEDLANRHLFFLDSRTTPASLVVAMSRAFGVMSASRDVFLDDIQTPDAIGAQLAEAEAHARRDGVAIVIGHPHPTTLDALQAWTAKLQGFDLIRVRDAIRLKTERDVRSVSLAGR